MKKGIHPNYELKEIRCSCGNVIKTKTTERASQLKSALHATRSSQAHRSLLTQQEESRDSTEDTEELPTEVSGNENRGVLQKSKN